MRCVIQTRVKLLEIDKKPINMKPCGSGATELDLMTDAQMKVAILQIFKMNLTANNLITI